MKDCLFCKIVNKEVPAEIVYEDESTFAFLDIAPNNPGHTLIVPKEHAYNVLDIDEDQYLNVMRTVYKLAPKIKQAVDADGINIANNNGKYAGQVIPHLHIHIIPRYKDDGFRHWDGREYKTKTEEKEVGKKIRKELA